VLPRGRQVGDAVTSGAAGDRHTLQWNDHAAAPLSRCGSATSGGLRRGAADVPQPVREGILEYATTLYESRTGAREAKHEASAARVLPAGVMDLWRPFQIES
jgi:hypothetical protein